MYKKEGIAIKIPEKPGKAPKGSLPGSLPPFQKCGSIFENYS